MEYVNSVQSKEERRSKRRLFRRWGFSVQESEQFRDWTYGHILKICSDLAVSNGKNKANFRRAVLRIKRINQNRPTKKEEAIKFIQEKNGEVKIEEFLEKFTQSELDRLKYFGYIFEPRPNLIKILE